MNQIFCSKKFQKFASDVETELPTETVERSLSNWNGHLFFMDKKKCLVFVNSLTHYAIFMADIVKKDMKHFETFFYHRLWEQLEYDGVIDSAEAFEKLFPERGITLFKTNNDRRLTGRINTLVKTFKVHRQYKYDSFDEMRIVYENSLLNTVSNRGYGENRNKWISAVDNMRQIVDRV